VGALARDPGAAPAGEDAADLRDAFRAAYLDALFRELPLEGVLGGDEVHLWPPNPRVPDPAGEVWVQNWRIAEAAALAGAGANSWGIPSLVLAIRDGGEAFTLRGRILDLYGRSGGRQGANGVAGYGAPRSGEFFLGGGLAQRFDLGTVILNAEGKAVFVPGLAAPGAVPRETGFCPGGPPPDQDRVRRAFRAAWDAAWARGTGPLAPDAPAEYRSLRSLAWFIGPETGISGVYYQSFDRGTTVLLLTEAPGLPLGVKTLAGPFLDALLAAGQEGLPGAEPPDPAALEPEAGDPFGAALFRGLLRYGVPLTDSFPRPRGTEDGPGESGGGAGPPPAPRYREVQRFSRGWMEKTGG
jgi:hypothetical protein